VARLRRVQVVSREGEVSDAFDIREEIGLRMEYEVLKSGFHIMPHHFLYNEESALVFVTLDQSADWYQRPRPEGRYVSTAWIPGNFLNDGTYFVDCSLATLRPTRHQFDAQHIVRFIVTDNMGHGTARGDWTGKIPGFVRPRLAWETEYFAESK
jgi:lipopolysaccharide transport system ATP-binding protein